MVKSPHLNTRTQAMKLLITFILSINYLFAVSAFPGELSFTQYDGSKFQGHLVGDEWLNYVSLENDYVAIFNKDTKDYEYAVIEVVDGKNTLVTSKQKVQESLHLNNPQELAKTISPLNLSALSTLDRTANRKHFEKDHGHKDKNTSKINKKILNTKSTQWKEVLKQKSPSK